MRKPGNGPKPVGMVGAYGATSPGNVGSRVAGSLCTARQPIQEEKGQPAEGVVRNGFQAIDVSAKSGKAGKQMKLKTVIAFVAMMLMSMIVSASTLNCAKVFSDGKFEGHLIDVIDKDGYRHTNFIMKTDSGDMGCIQFTDDHNTKRYNIIMNAFILKAHVTISTDREHNITGIGYRNDE
ncbi:hypothetical protein [Chromobacterium sp. ATCC 53434]|uniref:hypothetical protein n=1 Tax=Chromobacterium sp. (strain ATCC 53434 / SC 14030) TaxID=2059672 RepID=UPI001305212C|nr:hypothetical protein [Chromobacterium sp. ATCC 53434]